MQNMSSYSGKKSFLEFSCAIGEQLLKENVPVLKKRVSVVNKLFNLKWCNEYLSFLKQPCQKADLNVVENNHTGSEDFQMYESALRPQNHEWR